MFVVCFCISISSAADIVNYNGEGVTVKDIDLLRFRLDLTELNNATIDSSQDAYYSFGPSGTMNVSNCEGVPVRRL